MKRIIPIYVVLFLYMIINIILPGSNISNNYIYFFNPILILFLTIFITMFTSGIKNRNRGKYSKIQDIIIIMLLYVFIYYISGLIFGFSYNGYSTSLDGIIINFLSFYSIIFLEEYSRYRLLNYDRSKLNIVLVTLFFIIINTDVYYFIGASHLDLFTYIIKSFIPIIIINVTLSYLAYNTDYLACYIYRGIIDAIIIFSPIITNLNGLIMCLLYLVLSYYIYSTLSNKILLEDRIITRRRIKSNSDKIMILLFIFVFIIILFIFGVFRYKPVTILSSSMKNAFDRGDIVIVEKINSCDNLKRGDIIYYKNNNEYIVHRIVSIDYLNNKYIIKTQGDNNLEIDDWDVKEENIEGIIRGNVKYLGWPSIIISELFR